MITLHESTITSFPLDNGIGVLSDAINAYAEEELNGLFEFEMEYDIEGHLVEELKEERIIKAFAQDKLSYQLFRIYNITKNHESDSLIVRAQHITYDLADNFVEEVRANGLTKRQVMELIGNSAVDTHPFNVTSTNNTTTSSTNLYRTNPLQMIAGMQGSVLQIWGGQIERDNFDLIMHDRRGHDDGVEVTYEKNITGLEANFDISGLVTRIFPFYFKEATDEEPEKLITVNGKYVDSSLIHDYSKIYNRPIDYTQDERIKDEWSDSQIREKLTELASNYFSETGNDKRKAELDVQFQHLWETEEYKDVAPLELVGMGDTVTVNHSKLNVQATSVVNYIKYNCLTDMNEEVRLGSVKARFSDSINKIEAIEKKVDEAESNANQAIVSANGKNTTYYGPDEPTNPKKGDLWFKIVDGQYTQTYRFDGIEWQLIMDLESHEAKEEAKAAKESAEEAYKNANLATKNAQDAINKSQEGFDKALESLGKSEESFNLAQDSFNKTLENAKEVDSLAYRIVGANRVTHDIDMWAQGSWSTTSGAAVNHAQYIRLKDFERLDSNTEYTLTSYGDYRVTILLFDKSKNYVSFYNASENNYISFKTSEDITYFKVSINGLRNITPSMIGDEIKLKLEKGTTSSDWTMYDPDYTNIVANQKGLQAKIENAQGDVTNLTAIAEGLQLDMNNAQGDINRLQLTSQGISGQLQSVNTRLDELDGDDRNLITHLPQKWEQGAIVSSTGAVGSANSGWVRLVDFYPIKGKEVVTLSSYEDYNVYIYLYDDLERYIDFKQSSYDGSNTFTTPANARYFKIGIRNRESSAINPGMMGTDIKAKLSYTEVRTEWTPNFNDTGELVNNVQTFVHDFNVTAESLASRISDNENNYNQLVRTVDGTQQQIGNMKGDLSTITNIAEASQRQLTNLAGEVNTLTSTATSLVSRLDNSGGRNLIPYSRGDSLIGWQKWGVNNISIAEDYLGHDWIWVRRTAVNAQVGVNTPIFNLKANKTYTISFLIRSRSNSGYQLNYIYLRQGNTSITSIKRLSSVNMSDAKFEGDIAGDGLRVWFTFKHDEDIDDARVLLAIADRPDNAGFLIREVQIEQSEVLNPWQPSPEEGYSQFSQLQRDINLRIKEGELLSQINVEADRILIDSSDKLVLSADTTYVTGDFKLDGSANIKDASIGTAQIGTIDAAIASIINLSANSIVGGMLAAQNNRVTFDLNRGLLNIDDGAINIKRPDGAIWVENGIPKFNFNVQTEQFLDSGTEWNGQWYQTNKRALQFYKIASFRHEGRYLKMNVITRLSGYSPSSSEYMYFGVQPLNGNVIKRNHLDRVMVRKAEGNSHILTIDMGTPTYQTVSVYLVFRKEDHVNGGGTHENNIVQVRTNRIWQEG